MILTLYEFDFGLLESNIGTFRILFCTLQAQISHLIFNHIYFSISMIDFKVDCASKSQVLLNQSQNLKYILKYRDLIHH